jgi:hypothetical protein
MEMAGCWEIYGGCRFIFYKLSQLIFSSMKINFKLGGTNHILDNTPWYGARPFTMVVGADVSHIKGRILPFLQWLVWLLLVTGRAVSTMHQHAFSPIMSR